jgi:hypothetical protein
MTLFAKSVIASLCVLHYPVKIPLRTSAARNRLTACCPGKAFGSPDAPQDFKLTSLFQFKISCFCLDTPCMVHNGALYFCRVNVVYGGESMVSYGEYKRMSREVGEGLRHLQEIVSIFKNETRLTKAGIDFIHHAKAAGLKQSKIAEILEITPAAVTYHLR